MSSIVRELREEKGYTQHEIAKMVNKSIRQYQRYEWEKSKLPFDVAMNLSHIFNVPIEQLFK